MWKAIREISPTNLASVTTSPTTPTWTMGTEEMEVAA
jgi:hypothetical protein